MAMVENETGQDVRFRKEVGMPRLHKIIFLVLLCFLIALPFMVYPIFAMKVMCFALFAAAFNLLLGFGGLLSFGHAAYFGGASYVAAHAAKVWGFTPELAVLRERWRRGAGGLAIGLAGRFPPTGDPSSPMVTLALRRLSISSRFSGGLHRWRGRNQACPGVTCSACSRCRTTSR